MKIDVVSDLHGSYPELSGSDLLIVAGDLTARDTQEQLDVFDSWLDNQSYEKKIFIAGNHDGILVNEKAKIYRMRFHNKLSEDVKAYERFEYLLDSGTEYQGIKIWGSPWTPTFYNWYFMKNRGEEIKKQWDLIPRDTEILITHGPAFGLCDQVSMSSKRVHENHAGCEELRKVIEDMPNLKLHVFGHIHDGYGTCVLKKPGYGDKNNVLCVNASIMDGDYNPVNKPISIEYTSKGARLL